MATKKTLRANSLVLSPLTFLFCDQFFSYLPSASMSQKHKKKKKKKLKPLRNQNNLNETMSVFLAMSENFLIFFFFYQILTHRALKNKRIVRLDTFAIFINCVSSCAAFRFPCCMSGEAVDFYTHVRNKRKQRWDCASCWRLTTVTY